jgi:hypothetical protein
MREWDREAEQEQDEVEATETAMQETEVQD